MKTQRQRQNATKRADALYSALIRSRGWCEAAGYRLACKGNLQCAHIIRRTYRATRWRTDPRNALCLCAAHHFFFTHHDLDWRDFIEVYRPGRWDTLREIALHGGPEKAVDAVARLKGLMPLDASA